MHGYTPTSSYPLPALISDAHTEPYSGKILNILLRQLNYFFLVRSKPEVSMPNYSVDVFLFF